MKRIYSGFIVILSMVMLVNFAHAEIIIPYGIEPVAYDVNNTNDPIVYNNEYLKNVHIKIHFITSDNLLDLASNYFNEPSSIKAMIYPTTTTCDIYMVEWKDWRDYQSYAYFGNALRICIEPNGGTSPDFN